MDLIRSSQFTQRAIVTKPDATRLDGGTGGNLNSTQAITPLSSSLGECYRNTATGLLLGIVRGRAVHAGE